LRRRCRVWLVGALLFAAASPVAGPPASSAARSEQTSGAGPPQTIEQARTDGFDSAGRIVELASSGTWVAALVDYSSADREHAVAWSASTHRVVRFTRPAPGDPDLGTLGWLTLKGAELRWLEFVDSGMDEPELVEYRADLRHPGARPSSRQIGEYPPPRVPPASETHRGVVFAFNRGTIHLTRRADGASRTVRPPGGAIDAELEGAGLYYGYNVPHAARPGRVVFVPLARLFR
jgi:hypothetical protein